MAIISSNFVNNLSEGIQEVNANLDTMIENVKHVELNISIATVSPNM